MLDVIHQKSAPFTLFSIENFLNLESIVELSREFPLEKHFPKKTSLGKSYMDSRDFEFRDFIASHPIWSNLTNMVNKQTFLNHLLDKLRGAPELDFLKNYPSPVLHQDFYSITNKGKEEFHDELGMRFSFEFSSMLNGAYLPPHTDSTSKLLSILIYLPEAGKSLEYYSELSRLRTNFFISKNKSTRKSWDSMQLADSELREFYSNHNLLYSPEFVLGNIVGFLKSDLSWHSVEAILCSRPLIRNSFNISLYTNITEQKIRCLYN